MRTLNPDAKIHTLRREWSKLCSILDEGNRWASFLEVLPYHDCNEIEILARAAEQKAYTSPAKVLLLWLASKDPTIQMVKQWLKKIQLEKALIVLEDDVPLRIVQQPCPYVEIEEGMELLLTCLAEAFPDPEYQWYKDSGENELEGESRPTLRIPCAQLDDAGTYVCRVHTYYMDGERDCAFSNFSRVEVLPSSVRGAVQYPHPHPHILQQQPERNFLDPMEMASNVDNLQTFQISGRRYESSSTVKIVEPVKKDIRDLKIIKHPVSPGIVNQGSTVILECKAQSSLPVYYQWFCNGDEMPGETSNELKLSNLYLDTYTGEYYFCGVYTEAQGLKFSADASVQLNGFDDSIQYFAADKVALLIANNIYEELDSLIAPPNDVATLSRLLKSIGFKVIALMNLNLTEMKKAVYVFCESLKKGSYGLVYYAGHGFEHYKQSYFQPIDASKSCLPQECVCVEEILQYMQEKEPALSVLLIDMCRKLPKQFREGENIQPGKIYKPCIKGNVVCGYATSFLRAAYESNKSSHGYFMKYLKEHITKKQCILDILYNVRCDIAKDRAVSNLQYPWVENSLSSRRKLTDPVTDKTPDIVADDVTWKELQSSPFDNIDVHLRDLGASIILEFLPHKEEFCNAADLYVYIEAKSEDSYAIVSQFDVDFKFNLENISHNLVAPRVECNGSRICCCIIEIFHLQQIEHDLTGTLRISHRQTGVEIVKLETPPLAQPPISKLNCAEFWQRLHNTVIEDASHSELSIVLPNRCHVQNHYDEHYEGDLISFSGEITTL